MSHTAANSSETESFEDPTSGVFRVDSDLESRRIAEEWFDGLQRTQRAKRLRQLAYPTWLKSEDVKDLSWFFRQTRDESKSATASTIAFVEQRRRVAAVCVRCGGDEKTNSSGTGFIHSRPRAVAQRQADLLGLIDIPVDLPPDIGDQLCPDCDGRGWLIGARKHKRLRAEKGHRRPPASPFRVPNGQALGLASAYECKSNQPGDAREMSGQMHESLGRAGKILIRFSRAEELDGGEIVRLVFDCYHGPDGGSVGALWHLTPAGRKLLRDNPYKLHHRQLFENLRNEQSLSPKPNRGALFKAADEQAKRLYERCCQLWNEANGVTMGGHEDAIERALAGEQEGA